MWSLLVSGIMAADAAVPAQTPPAVPLSAVEITFATHAGEGATGRKRFMRDGCYQIESGGGTGGAGYARDSQAGCHLPADVAAVLAKLAAIGSQIRTRERASAASAAGGARADGLGPGLEQTRVVLVRPDGSRWVADNQAVGNQLLAAVNELPSENQWYATPPAKPIGAGAQLVVLAVTTSGDSGGSKRVEATLASDGRWWCHRSVIGARGSEQKLPATKALALKDAPARLGRIFEGITPAASDEAQTASSKRADRIETSIEVAWPGQGRGALRAKSRADKVADRFGAEMQALSPACAIAPAPAAR
jgi:hypothetical protein